MKLHEKIQLALKEDENKEFLFSQLNIIRENILEAEVRIGKCFTVLLSLITVSELINLKIISKISFFSTEIGQLQLVLLAMPVLISYYTYTLFNQIILRKYLSILFSNIIKSKYKTISELDIDYFLITHLAINTEMILISGKKNLLKFLIELLTAPSIIIFQYLPLVYSIYILTQIYLQENNIGMKFWMSLILTIIFFTKALLLLIAMVKEEGGLNKISQDVIDSYMK